MPIRVGIIGLGIIAKAYRKGLEENPSFHLRAVCDLDKKNASSYNHYEDLPFYYDYSTMIKEQKLDLVIVSTPPKTHYNIAMNVMKIGVGVLLEKPAVTRYQDLVALIDYAKKQDLIFDCMLHWQHANEIVFLKNHFPDLHQATSFKTTIKDPYTLSNQKTIKDAKIPLNGTWFDSGVNALSMISLFYSLQDFNVNSKTVFIDKKSELPYYSNYHFKSGNYAFSILVNWRKNIAFKKTDIRYHHNKIRIIHHLEEVYENSKLIYRGSKDNRMQSHYYNYFKAFNPLKINHNQLLVIHKTLFEECSNEKTL